MEQPPRPDAIFLADLHLQPTTPKCRQEGEFLHAMWTKLEYIQAFRSQWREPVPIFVAGDITHRWNNPPWFLRWLIKYFPPDSYVVCGQHDLPAHRLDRVEKSTLGVLEAAGVVRILGPAEGVLLPDCSAVIVGWPWGTTPERPTDWDSTPELRIVALTHTFTYKGKAPWPGCVAPTDKALLRKFKGYDLVVAGDNHTPSLTSFKNGRKILVPGSLMRISADQVDHDPRMYLYYAKNNSIVIEPLPFDRDAVSREHLERESQQEQRISAFVETLEHEFEVELSFRHNLDEYMRVNKLPKRLRIIINEAMEGEND